MTTLNPALAKVLKRLHYPLEVILRCVRRYVAYPLSLCHLEEMMAERGIAVDHSTVHRWALKLLPVLEKAFRRRKRPVGKSWRMDETYIRVLSPTSHSPPPHCNRTRSPWVRAWSSRRSRRPAPVLACRYTP
jgi:hypothetical protein